MTRTKRVRSGILGCAVSIRSALPKRSLTLLVLITLSSATLHGQEALYVSSSGNNAIHSYNKVTGASSGTFVDGGTSGLDGPVGVTFGPDGNLYCTSFATDQIRRYNGATGAFIDNFVSAGSGGLDRPNDSMFGPDGNLYVASSGTEEVLRYNGATGAFIDVFVSAGSGGLSEVQGVTFGPDGNLYLTSLLSDEILRYNGATGAFIDAFVSAGSGGLDTPVDLRYGPDGNLYVASSTTEEILRYNGVTGAFLDAFVSAGSGGLDSPESHTFGPDGNLYVTSGGSDEVLRYNGATGAFIDAFVSSGSGGMNDPTGHEFGPDGNLYLASFGSDDVHRYNGATGAFIDVFVSDGAAGLNQPDGLTLGPDQNLYASSRGTQEIVRYNGATGAFIDTFVPAGSGGLDAPRELSFGPDGNLYVCSSGNDQVLRYNGATGAFIDAFVSAGSGGLDDPFDHTFGPDGNLYVSSRGTDEVLRYNGATGAFIDAFVSSGSGGLSGAVGLIFGPDGNLYVCSAISDEVLRYNGATGAFIDAFVSAGSGGLNGPSQLTCGPAAPANDACADAIAIGEGTTPYDSSLASTDGPSPCGAIGRDLWYSFAAPEAGTVTVTTCNDAAYDTALAIYPGGGCPTSAVEALACNDDFPGCGLTSTISMDLATGDTILVQVGGFAGQGGAGVLTLVFDGAPLPIDVSAFDVVLVNGEGDVDGGLVLSQTAYTDALTAVGLTFIEIEPNVSGQVLTGCPTVAWIYNNGTFPDDAPVDAEIMVNVRDCVLLTGNNAMVNGGDLWGFLAPTAYDEVDGIDEASSTDGGDDVTDLSGVVGSALDGFASLYTQDQAGNDWTDNLALAAVGAGTEAMGDNQEVALVSPAASAILGADYNVGVYYPHDDAVAPGAGDTFSMSIEPSGVDDPAAFLADCFALLFFSKPPGELFSRGDCSNDGSFDIGDPIFALSHLFSSGPMFCLDACDANDDGGFDIGDAISLLNTLFALAPPPAAPSFPACGVDSTADGIDCATQPMVACP